MNLIWLEDFLALAQTGHFSRAAEVRCSSQPAFSRRIRSLEEWLGTDLVDRSCQPTRLTAAGEWFRGVAENMVGQIARLPDEAQQVAETQAVTLRMASTHGLSFVFLPRWLRQIESSFVMERLELLSDVLSRCEVLMQQGQVHFVLTHAHPSAPSPLDADTYEALKIGLDELVAVSRANDMGQPMHVLGAEKKHPPLSWATPTPQDWAEFLRRFWAGGLKRCRPKWFSRPIWLRFCAPWRSMAGAWRGFPRPWSKKTWLRAGWSASAMAHGTCRSTFASTASKT